MLTYACSGRQKQGLAPVRGPQTRLEGTGRNNAEKAIQFRRYRAIPSGMDAASGRIVAATLTDRGVDDASRVALCLIRSPSLWCL